MPTDSTSAAHGGDSLDPLARALRDRNFELFVSVRIASPVERKISVIKEVRALTGIGLKDAKDAVEQEQIILDALAPDQAERVSERLAAAGGHSALLLARAHLYAYLPEHTRRAAQTCERLTVVGQTIELAHGQLGAWGQAQTQTVPVGDGELLAAIDRQRESWAAAGFREAGTEMEILERVSARDEELEARVCAAEGGAIVQEAAVYGDWLLAQGDARGHVASGALSLDAASDDVERVQRVAALIEIVTEHAGHLFGPARPLFDQHCMQLEWLGPMIASAKLTEVSGNEFDHLLMLERLLGLPVCAGLRTLVLQSRFTEHHELGDLIAHSRCAANLRSLSIFGGPRVSFADASFERLEQLELFTTEIGIGALSAPSLRRFVLELRFPLGQLPINLARFDAPSLEHFEFGTMTYDYWEQHEGPLHRMLGVALEQPAFARLRSLTLRSLPSSLPYGGGLAQMLARLPARHTLERIDLRQANLAPQARVELDQLQGGVRGGPELLLP